MFRKLIVGAALTVAYTASAQADCGISNGRVSIIGNEFPAIQLVAAGAEKCGSGNVTVKSNLTADHQKLNVAGMTGNPAEYTSAIIANSSLVALMNEDVVRPLNDLVEKHGQSLKPSQLITIDGNIMAIAFMANAQTLLYRKDVLAEIGVEVPTSYEEVIAAAKMIKEKGIMENPLGGAYKAGWNVAEEFVNMYLGYGGEFYKPGTAEVSINNEQGIAAAEMMKELVGYMNPDFLTHDSNATSAEWEAGKVAMMNMWGSRVGPLKDGEGSTAEIEENTIVAGPLTAGGNDLPASTLWWDGFTVAKNISDEDAEATFIAMMAGIDASILNDDTMPLAVWFMDGYEPSDISAGVFAAIEAGTTPYPMLPYQGLLHTALGAELSDFLQGKEDAAKALADVEAAYTAAAKEKGFL